MPTLSPPAQTVRERREHACSLFESRWQTGQFDPDLVTEDYQACGLTTEPTDAAGEAAAVAAVHEAFPDLRTTVRAVVCEGDFVAVHFSATGTHERPIAGVSATGEQVRTGGMVLYAFEDGLVAESRTFLDVSSLLDVWDGIDSPST
ncbi:ester cyclase [Haloarchaeobius amylolyticus]|uniref:ester cyclase n=1 Tax=Haloarchaeobius amylolyticus TaxID=1198296 RepID=UPI002271040C|nr:ester cyclase [Haloarchaeobius amylolyticus]